MKAMAFQDFLILTFEKYSKNCGCFNPQFIEQYKKKDYLKPSQKIKSFFKSEKNCSFCVFKKKNPKCYFLETFSLTTHLDFLFYFFGKSNQKVSHSTLLG